MLRACPVHLCLTRKCYIINIGWASYKDVTDDGRRYGVIFLGFQMRPTLHHTLMFQRRHDVMAHMHHCQQCQETIGHIRAQLHHKPQNQCVFLDVNVEMLHSVTWTQLCTNLE
jgi:hypothetical protein